MLPTEGFFISPYLKKGPNVKTEFLEIFWENWVFMFMEQGLTNFIKRSVLSQVVSVDTLDGIGPKNRRRRADRNTYFFFRDDRLEDMGLDGKFNWISPLVIMGTTLHIYTPWFIYRHVKNYFGDSVTVEMINNSLFSIIKETFKVVNDINEMDDYLLYYEVYNREDEDEDSDLYENIQRVKSLL